MPEYIPEGAYPKVNKPTSSFGARFLSTDPAVVDGDDAQEIDNGALVVDELVEPDSTDDGEYAGGHVSAVVPGGPGAPTLPAPPSEGGTATVEELVVVEFDIVSVAISGVAQVGQTLTSAIEFSLTPDYVEFQWFAGDELIEGVEGDTLLLTKDLIGKTIALGVYGLHEDFEDPEIGISNEFGRVTGAAVVIVDTDKDKQVEKVTQQVKRPAPKSSTGELAQTGADVTGAVLAGLSFMLLGLGGVWLRRRATQS